jgi:hypothetical protein
MECIASNLTWNGLFDSDMQQTGTPRIQKQDATFKESELHQRFAL